MCCLAQRLPDEFIGGLNEHGDGSVVIRYGGKRIHVTVKGRELRSGWKDFLRQGCVITGNILLVAYNGGLTISILKFKKGMGSRSAWDSNVDVFNIDSELVDDGDLPEDVLNVVSESYPAGYFPSDVTLFFARESGICVYEQTSYMTMAMPPNLAQYLRCNRRTSVNIRNENRGRSLVQPHTRL
ncbi:hypothetical protein LIER_17028 [Lithospermum erythrorhizon]|uniref:TF-B3 domain-containing protein n=1 Tax=Lithospermum erythrorhizon TaxID=34254 RepID=A0AAV3Q8V6_LITER